MATMRWTGPAKGGRVYFYDKDFDTLESLFVTDLARLFRPVFCEVSSEPQLSKV